MALKKGDIIDEHKRHPDSCGLVLKVMNGGEGFEKIRCCGGFSLECPLMKKKSRQIPAAYV
jgi:hypothetical protein